MNGLTKKTKNWLIRGLAGLLILGGCTDREQREQEKQKEQEILEKNQARIAQLYQESQELIIVTVIEEIYRNQLSPVPKHHKSGGSTISGGFFGGGGTTHYESFSNETVKLERKYVLKTKTDDGRILGVDIIDGDGKDKTKEGLDAIIEPGSKISFPKGNLYSEIPHRQKFLDWHYDWTDEIVSDDYILKNVSDDKETYFTGETQFGTKPASRIRVIDFAENKE